MTAALVSVLFVAIAHAEDATGILKVKSNVAGADVFLDGELVGDAPLTRYVPVGTHRLRVVADDHDPFVRAIDVAADQTVDVNAQLSPGRGTVEFTGPKGAQLSFDGTTYPLPTRMPAPAVGRHDWVVTAPGYETQSGVLEFAAGRNYLLDVALESSAGHFVVDSTPPGAEVWLDGVQVGTTPWRAKDIPAGVHGVRIHADGLSDVLRSVDTRAGVRGEVDVKLGGAGGGLTVTTGHDDARVTVNDAPIGTGGTVRLDAVAPGRVVVAVTWTGGSASGTFRVPGGGSLLLRVEGDTLLQRKPLTQRWGFWAALGGGAVAVGAGTAVVAVATQPPPAPSGATVVTLP